MSHNRKCRKRPKLEQIQLRCETIEPRILLNNDWNGCEVITEPDGSHRIIGECPANQGGSSNPDNGSSKSEGGKQKGDGIPSDGDCVPKRKNNYCNIGTIVGVGPFPPGQTDLPPDENGFHPTRCKPKRSNNWCSGDGWIGLGSGDQSDRHDKKGKDKEHKSNKDQLQLRQKDLMQQYQDLYDQLLLDSLQDLTWDAAPWY